MRFDEEEDVAVGSVGLGSDALSVGEITLWPEGMWGRPGRVAEGPLRERCRELDGRERMVMVSSKETRVNDCGVPGLRTGAEQAWR